MTRFAFALLLGALTALAASRVEAPVALGQDKKKDKKAKTPDPAAEAKEGEGELGRVRLAFDPGSHTRPISALGFNKDQSKLITVGWDYSIQVWSTATGERLDILHLPPYGRDNGAEEFRWNHAAVSSDGAFVAVGGSSKVFGEDKVGTRTRLVVVDVANRRIRRVVLDIGAGSRVSCLAFSADGDRLAFGTSGALKAVYLLDGVKDRLGRPPEDPACVAPKLVTKALTKDADDLALSRKGDRLAVAEQQGAVWAWDVSGTMPAKWAKTGEIVEADRTDVLAWSPDGSHFARAWTAGQGGELRGIELRGIDGKQIKGWTYKELTPGFGSQAVAATMLYLAPDRLFVSAHGGTGTGFGTLGVVLDPKTGKTVRRFSDTSDQLMYTPFGAASETGDLAASTTPGGMDVAIYRLSDGKVVTHCGSRSPTPTIVGWAADPKTPAVAWGDGLKLNPHNSKTSDLKYAFDLAKVEPAARFAPADFDLRRTRVGEWSLEFMPKVPGFRDVKLKQDGQPGTASLKASGHSMTLVPNGNEQPLLAFGTFDAVNQMGGLAYLVTTKNNLLASWFPMATKYRDMVSSPDGRYVLASTGTHRLAIYRTDGSQFPFLQIVQANGEWACWTAEGYYAASPGGEKMIGWAAHNGPNELATFHPAEKFARQFRRPDVIKLAIEKGSVKQALASLNTKPVEVEEILPPSAKMELVEQRGSTVKVKAAASSGAKDKPVLAMRVLLDGRPLPGGVGVWAAEAGKPAEGVYEFDVPPGAHEVKVLARSEDGAAVSDPLVVRGPKVPGSQPTLYRVCVGVDEYDDPGLKLSVAAKDARDMFEALAANCVGNDNRFGAAKGEVILNKEATRERVLKALADARKAAKPGDLVVVFFAGHGVRQGDGFYLLTREADPGKDLKGSSLSGDDLRKALAEVECPVLLVMDACHSAAGVKSLRSGTDDLTRALTDDAVGVTVLSAAMAHETAGATAANGHLTAGLLKGLKAGEGVPFDPYERQLYVHHLYAVAFSEVRRASGGKQNPFLNMPWTVPPLAIREVAGK